MKDIKNFEEEYAVYEDGRVWSHKRQMFLIPRDNGSGYLQVMLYKDGKHKNFRVHRLVAEAFIPNPNNLPYINHKDEDKHNNSIDNLEWCDRKYNNNYGTRNERMRKSLSVPVYCEELNREFYGAHEAARQLGLNQTNITQCCKGNQKTTGGYHFRYKEVS